MKVSSLLILLFIVGCSSQKVLQNQASYQVDEKLLIEVQSEFLARSPASTIENEELSSKRVYFKTLYEQYLTFTKLSGVQRNINHCPAFHKDFLEARELDIVNTVKKLEEKVARTENELSELCEKGVTSDYYRFENLVNYHASKKSFHQNPGSLFSLLKISIFENMYELKTRYGVVLSHNELIELTQAYWFTSYLVQYKVNETALVRR